MQMVLETNREKRERERLQRPLFNGSTYTPLFFTETRQFTITDMVSEEGYGSFLFIIGRVTREVRENVRLWCHYCAPLKLQYSSKLPYSNRSGVPNGLSPLQQRVYAISVDLPLTSAVMRATVELLACPEGIGECEHRRTCAWLAR